MLLLVAPTEHKVRIEVGYGLEGTLTDALSSVIISSAIVPRFKTGDFSGGIERGVDGIISVLSGDAAEWHRKVNVRSEDASADFNKLFPLLFFGLLFLVMWYLIRHAGGGPGSGGRRSGVGPIILGSGWGGGFGGGFSGRRRVWRRWIFRRRRLVGRRRRVRGLVMQLSKEEHATLSRSPFMRRKNAPAGKSSASWRGRQPTMPTSQFCGRAGSR